MLLLIWKWHSQNLYASLCVTMQMREFLSFICYPCVLLRFHSLLAYFSMLFHWPFAFNESKIRWRCSVRALIYPRTSLPLVMDTFQMRMFFISFKNNILFSSSMTHSRQKRAAIQQDSLGYIDVHLWMSLFCWFRSNKRDNFRIKWKYPFPLGKLPYFKSEVCTWCEKFKVLGQWKICCFSFEILEFIWVIVRSIDRCSDDFISISDRIFLFLPTQKDH